MVDFAEHYAALNSNAFVNIWADFGERLKKVFLNDYNSDVNDIEWSENIANFLILLKLFPCSPGRNGLASRVAFEKAIKKLIIFSKVKSNFISHDYFGGLYMMDFDFRLLFHTLQGRCTTRSNESESQQSSIYYCRWEIY